MRKIILDLAVTLDGFIEGPNGEIDWCIMDEEMNFDAFLADIDTIFYGRISYDLWGNYQPQDTDPPAIQQLFAAIHGKQKIVFSRTQQSHPDDGQVLFISDNIESQVNTIKNSPGKNIWLYGGASLITTFIASNLIDEYRLSVHPVALGKGKPLFETIQQRLNLSLIQTKVFQSGVVQLCYLSQQNTNT